MPAALRGQCIGERDSNGAVFAADHQIDMSHFISVAC